MNLKLVNDSGDSGILFIETTNVKPVPPWPGWPVSLPIPPHGSVMIHLNEGYQPKDGDFIRYLVGDPYFPKLTFAVIATYVGEGDASRWLFAIDYTGANVKPTLVISPDGGTAVATWAQ